VLKKTGWRNKLHPAFFELAELNRRFEIEWSRIQLECRQGLESLGQKATAQLRDKVVSRLREKADELMTKFDEKCVEINQRYPQLPYNSLAYGYFDARPGQPTDDLVPYLHWMRHGESLQRTEAEDAKGDIKAWRKLARTAEDQRRIVYSKGPIKPFQGDTVHRQLLELILCFEIERLTAEERADCADAYCACGKTHDADALKKQAARLKSDLQRGAIQPVAATIPTRSTEKKKGGKKKKNKG
jgi:hypothetical protein